MKKTEVPMPNRERFLAICRSERPGDVPLIDWFHRSWPETTEEWVKQGAPEYIKTGEGFNRYFQLGHLHSLQEYVKVRSFISRDTGNAFLYGDTPASLATGIRD